MRASRIVLIITSLIILTPQRQLAQKSHKPASPPITTNALTRRAMENMIRVIEIYSETGNLKKAGSILRLIESDMDQLSKRLGEEHPVVEKLQETRYGLMRAELVSKAITTNKRLHPDESTLITETMWFYECDTGAVEDCLKVVMAEARKSQRQALTAAVESGLYTP